MWREPEQWRELLSESGCLICRAGRPGDVLAELTASWATGGSEAPLPGYVCVVAKRHVVEPWELPSIERSAFWDDVVAVARAVASAAGVVKMNYEIHGNTIPHLHMHLFPRFSGDPYEGRALDGHTTFHRSAADLERLADAISSSGRRAGGREEERASAERRVAIRPAVPADAAGIAEVYRESAWHHVSLDPEFYRHPAKREVVGHYSARLAHEGDGEGVFVAVDGSRILGVVEIRFLPPPREGSMIAPVAAVDIGISVREGSRGAGIGNRLMAAAEDWALERGADFVVLNMSARNEAALAFYRGLGYEISGLFLRKRLGRR